MTDKQAWPVVWEKPPLVTSLFCLGKVPVLQRIISADYRRTILVNHVQVSYKSRSHVLSANRFAPPLTTAAAGLS